MSMLYHDKNHTNKGSTPFKKTVAMAEKNLQGLTKGSTSYPAVLLNI